MGLVFVNIKHDMLNMASAALLATANGMSKEQFMSSANVPFPSPDHVSIALTQIMLNIISHTGNEKDPVIFILEQTIRNLSAKEGPKLGNK